jgi:hypothetical protein
LFITLRQIEYHIRRNHGYEKWVATMFPSKTNEKPKEKKKNLSIDLTIN